jgi:hypothetical protein
MDRFDAKIPHQQNSHDVLCSTGQARFIPAQPFKSFDESNSIPPAMIQNIKYILKTFPCAQNIPQDLK